MTGDTRDGEATRSAFTEQVGARRPPVGEMLGTAPAGPWAQRHRREVGPIGATVAKITDDGRFDLRGAAELQPCSHPAVGSVQSAESRDRLDLWRLPLHGLR